jgi:type II secretory pathway pseudopilin PulG
MILKALLLTSDRSNNQTKGFTLIELIVGLLITVIVGGLAMNAFVNANSTFSKDKKNIESNQNLSTILEIIGNDIKQAGENINDNNFPTIEFKEVSSTDVGLKSGSSKVIIRRALSEPLTLCQTIAANVDPTTTLSLVVADNTPATVTASANCNVGTLSSKLFAARPSTLYELTATTDPVPSPALSLVLPSALRKVRDYRCKLDDLNPTTAYDSAAATDDFCGSPTATLEKVRVAVSNQSGQVLIFNETNETLGAANTAIAKKYGITLNTTGLDTNTTANNTKNKAVAYSIGNPIYVIEERVYTLKTDGSFQLSIDGAIPQTLIKKIDNFRVSSKIYTNPNDKVISPTPASNVCTNAVPFANQETAPTISNPKYICQFNYFTGTSATDNANWKTLAGLKVEIQAKYDSSGGSATPSAQDTNKLYAAAEFFPRNVLSK